MSDAYAKAGVDVTEADAGVAAIVSVLSSIDTGAPSLSVKLPGHFAAVMRIGETTGLAICTDGVGSKLIVAEQTGRLDTVGIDCVAMNVNDLVCVGAKPIALVDYLAVEQSNPDQLRAIAEGLKAGAEQAGIEIPGGELAQVPELIRGHPSPNGFDLCATAVGTVELDSIITGNDIAVGDALIGVPASGLHSNGLTLARSVLVGEGGNLDDRPDGLGGQSIADVLLEPTVIYVRAALELIESDLPINGMFHITGGGLLNLLRLGTGVGYSIDEPLTPPAVYEQIASVGGIPAVEMYEVFNMGCGFAVAVAPEHCDDAVAILSRHHAGARRIGTVTGDSGVVSVQSLGITGDASGLRAA